MGSVPLATANFLATVWQRQKTGKKKATGLG
jgi:hypothetical protein